MDVKNLSSNWKKLQGSIKKESASSLSTKRKNPDSVDENGVVKKRKSESTAAKRTFDQTRITKKRKRMPENSSSQTDDGAKEAAGQSTSRRSSMSASRTETKTAKANEGRSKTLVFPYYGFILRLMGSLAKTHLLSAVPRSVNISRWIARWWASGPIPTAPPCSLV